MWSCTGRGVGSDRLEFGTGSLQWKNVQESGLGSTNDDVNRATVFLDFSGRSWWKSSWQQCAEKAENGLSTDRLFVSFAFISFHTSLACFFPNQSSSRLAMVRDVSWVVVMPMLYLWLQPEPISSFRIVREFQSNSSSLVNFVNNAFLSWLGVSPSKMGTLQIW